MPYRAIKAAVAGTRCNAPEMPRFRGLETRSHPLHPNDSRSTVRFRLQEDSLASASVLSLAPFMVELFAAAVFPSGLRLRVAGPRSSPNRGTPHARKVERAMTIMAQVPLLGICTPLFSSGPRHLVRLRFFRVAPPQSQGQLSGRNVGIHPLQQHSPCPVLNSIGGRVFLAPSEAELRGTTPTSPRRTGRATLVAPSATSERATGGWLDRHPSPGW